MSKLDDKIFLTFVIIILTISLVGTLIIFSITLKPWFTKSSPPIREPLPHPCDSTFDPPTCTSDDFNDYCSNINFDGSERLIPSVYRARCNEYCLNLDSDSPTYCQYMSTCAKFQDFSTCITCDVNELYLCSVDEITQICRSGIYNDQCDTYCKDFTSYSCNWLQWSDASDQYLNYICPVHFNCWEHDNELDSNQLWKF